MDAVEPVLRYGPVPTLASAHWIPDLLSAKFNEGPDAAPFATCGLLVTAAVLVERMVAVDLKKNPRRDSTLNPNASLIFKIRTQMSSTMCAILNADM